MCPNSRSSQKEFQLCCKPGGVLALDLTRGILNLDLARRCPTLDLPEGVPIIDLTRRFSNSSPYQKASKESQADEEWTRNRIVLRRGEGQVIPIVEILEQGYYVSLLRKINPGSGGGMGEGGGEVVPSLNSKFPTVINIRACM
jgi:hypothetical protein